MTNTPTATVFEQLADEVEIPVQGTLSRVIYKDDAIRVVLFAFDKDQELTEHTASMPAIVQMVSGRITLGLGDQLTEISPGSWVRMPANLRHSVHALEPSVMVLTLLR